MSAQATAPTFSDPMPGPAVVDRVTLAVARLDAWLETMRCPGGYGGPVVHWWKASFIYTGPGLDWRYEGIIAGYLTLWQRTGNPRWLHRACRAGDDILAGRLEDGHYAASCFELNPASAGTPGEAACDVALLLLAKTLKQQAGAMADWQPYADCAERNLRAYYVDRLWDVQAQAFRDDPRIASFVPNKAATACEALFLLADVREDESWVERFALPNLQRIVQHQVQDGGRLDGAISQNSLGGRRVEKYFPTYIARCVPALVAGTRRTGDERFADAARRAVQFLARQVGADGSLPTVIYPGGRANRYPSWIAPLADVLWAAEAVRAGGIDSGLDADFEATRQRLLAGQDESGGIQTAAGFAAQGGGRPGALPDVRDVLHVAGWCDKALRYLAGQSTGDLSAQAGTLRFEADCVLRGQVMRYRETPAEIEVSRQGRTAYRWRKGDAWAAMAAPEFWLQ